MFALLLAGGRRLPDFVTAAGRCSLTIYLAMSAAMLLLFSEWAGGLYGDVSARAAVMIGFVVWLGLAVGAQEWLRRHPSGPLESLMACWTERPAGRRRRADRSAGPSHGTGDHS